MCVPIQVRQEGRRVHLVWQGPLLFQNPIRPEGTNPRAMLSRNFKVYLEVADQCKHDEAIRAYCRGADRQPQETRHADGPRPDSGPGLAPDGFYSDRAQIAAKVVREHMVRKWQAPGSSQVKASSNTIKGCLRRAAMRQSDGYRYGSPTTLTIKTFTFCFTVPGR